MAIIRHTIPTTNYSKGRGGNKIDKIVIHWIVGSLASADATFKNPQRRASAHYGIENTKIIQWVDEKDTAWHASNFTVNQQSIGIEHSATPRRPATELTHKTSGKLVGEIAKRYNIKLDTAHIVPHKKYSNTQCPGTMDIGKIIKYAKEVKVAELWYIKDINAKKLEIANLKKVYADRGKAIASLKAQITQLQKDFKGEAGDIERSFKDTIDDLKKEIEQLQVEYTKCRDRGVTLTGEIEGLKEEIKAFKEPTTVKIPRVTKFDNLWSRIWKRLLQIIAR